MKKVIHLLHNFHFWILFVIFIIFIILHYPSIFLSYLKIEVNSFFGLERHAIERILFIAPISYAAFLFGIKGGITCLIISLIIMLPRALFISSYSKDALFETCLAVAIGFLL